MKRLAALAVGLALIVPSSAQASGPTYEQVVARSQGIAEMYWQARGIEPCGPVTVQIDTTVYGGELGTGDAGTCTMTLAPALRGDMTVPRYICGVVVHEYGHLAGLDHSADPASAMYPEVESPPAECAAFGHRHHHRRHRRHAH